MSNPFVTLLYTPDSHFKLCYYAAVMRLTDWVIRAVESREMAYELFPFLKGYDDEVGISDLPDDQRAVVGRRWQESLRLWESQAQAHLPLVALRHAAVLDDLDIMLVISAGLIEEDARFSLLFQVLQGELVEQPYMTLATLRTIWHDDQIIQRVRRLQELGLLHVPNSTAPRTAWILRVEAATWDVLCGRGATALPAWVAYTSPSQLLDYGNLLLPEAVKGRLETLPPLLTAGEISAFIVRGHQHNGRRTLIGSVARAVGRGLLTVDSPHTLSDERWRSLGVLATALNAIPVVHFKLAPADTVTLPRLHTYQGALGIVMGKQGGVTGVGAERALTLTLETPEPDIRRRLWIQAVGADSVADLDGVSERFRLTSGNIQRAAMLACTYASSDGRAVITLDDVQQASRNLNRQALDSIATFLPPVGDWDSLALSEETMREVRSLESRCRFREHLKYQIGGALGSQLTSGVRALFTGVSGTGKTLTARVLASVLGKDLYRLDLAAVINKYIGETEKNLHEAFSQAEELDVILLLDEGDALLTQRTNVHTSNDRYANLETNFLLQRLETFEGIILITTNASDRIDSAFTRRMDAVIEFQPPSPAERFGIWQLHLPQQHQVSGRALREIALRCSLKGGQIRNAALHAALLALTEGGAVTTEHIQAAVLREYRKSGEICPIRFGEV